MKAIIIEYNYVYGILIDKYRNFSKAILTSSIIFNLSILFIFKYLCFTINNIGILINKDFNDLSIALPLGISFFTFQAMSYVIDVYKKRIKVQKNLLDIALYISFFPQLVAGPIVRFETIKNDIQNRVENLENISNGIIRFIIGLGKKVLLADNIALIADMVFEKDISELSSGLAWLGAIAFTLQIYIDFSSYSDMAIGLGNMFGFHLPENFNYPYISSSITEFWRRWHISLSTWFRDYVYFPLGGNKTSKEKHYLNLLIVWLLTGLWHGANWTFIVWGLFYFCLITIEKISGLDKNKSLIGNMYTMLFVTISWVIFKSNNITYAFSFIKIMFLGINNSSFVSHIKPLTFLTLFLGICCSLPLFPIIQNYLNKLEKYEKLVEIANTIFIAIVFIFSVIIVCSTSYSPFIYFNF